MELAPVGSDNLVHVVRAASLVGLDDEDLVDVEPPAGWTCRTSAGRDGRCELLFAAVSARGSLFLQFRQNLLSSKRLTLMGRCS